MVTKIDFFQNFYFKMKLSIKTTNELIGRCYNKKSSLWINSEVIGLISCKILYWYFIVIWYILICQNISIYQIINDIFYESIYLDISRKNIHYNISIFYEISFYEIYRKLLKFFESFDISFLNISWYIANLTYQNISNHDISRYIAIYHELYRYIEIYRINFAIFANTFCIFVQNFKFWMSSESQ